MNKKILYIIAPILLISALIVASIFGWINNYIVGIFSAITVAVTSYIFKKALIFKYGLRLFLLSVFSGNSLIRFSPSYLFRIKIDDKFFLIKSNRMDWYQPVGGVYKYNDEAESFLDGIGREKDILFKGDKDNRQDLRIMIPAKNFYKLIEWFNSEKGRETTFNREFVEEMIDTKILDLDFASIQMNKIKNKCFQGKVFYDKYAKCYAFMPKDIIELVMIDEQLESFKKLTMDSGIGKKYIWAEAEEIKAEGAMFKQPTKYISDHSKFIL